MRGGFRFLFFWKSVFLRHPNEDVFLYLVCVERSNTGDLAAPMDTELCEDDDDDDADEDSDYYVDDDFDVDGEHRALWSN